MLYLDRQIRKTDLEIEILEHKLEVSAWAQVNYVNYWNINSLTAVVVVMMVTLNSKVIIANGVSDCSAVLDSWQVDGVIISVFNL